MIVVTDRSSSDPYHVSTHIHFGTAALEQHGMGNWGKVSELLNAKDKTEKACMEHYVDLYLHSYGSILPKVRFRRVDRFLQVWMASA